MPAVAVPAVERTVAWLGARRELGPADRARLAFLVAITGVAVLISSVTLVDIALHADWGAVPLVLAFDAACLGCLGLVRTRLPLGLVMAVGLIEAGVFLVLMSLRSTQLHV